MVILEINFLGSNPLGVGALTDKLPLAVLKRGRLLLLFVILMAKGYGMLKLTFVYAHLKDIKYTLQQVRTESKKFERNAAQSQLAIQTTEKIYQKQIHILQTFTAIAKLQPSMSYLTTLTLRKNKLTLTGKTVSFTELTAFVKKINECLPFAMSRLHQLNFLPAAMLAYYIDIQQE